jgi:hypothetical protein
MRGSRVVLLRCGVELGFRQGGVCSLGVCDGERDQSKGEEEVSGRVCLEFTSSPRCQSNRTNRKDFLGSFDSIEGDPQQISFLPLGRLAKRRKKIERIE